MSSIQFYLSKIESWVWGAPLLFFLTFVGVYLTIILRGIQFRYLFYSLKLAFTRHDDNAPGDISQFQALMTSLASTIGIGSITGVATAIATGGLGALFWMWIAALYGMATKYSEAILAVKYRSIDENKQMCGGPMYYLQRGLKSKFLAVFFAIAAFLACICTGNMIQAQSISTAVYSLFSIQPWVIGVFLAVVTAVALIKGIKSIGVVSSYLVPIMATLYILGGLGVIFVNIDKLPSVILTIFSSAFTGQAATGGFIGSSIMLAIQFGVSRGVFSSESGLGSSPIAAAAAKTDVPARQALISMSGVFITSFIVCSITGLAIGVTDSIGVIGQDGHLLDGSLLVLHAFDSVYQGGGLVVTLSLMLFGYSTILGWAYYGEKCLEYLCGIKIIPYYRIFYALVLIPGSMLSLHMVWSIANILNGFMTIPNLIGLIGLSKIVSIETKSFEKLLVQERKS